MAKKSVSYIWNATEPGKFPFPGEMVAVEQYPTAHQWGGVEKPNGTEIWQLIWFAAKLAVASVLPVFAIIYLIVLIAG